MPTARFVILHHRAPQGEHWDLMIEQGGVLATWQLLSDPRKEEAWPIPARRIGNHRIDYLTYEGPLSRGRGDVTRIDEGDCACPNDSGFGGVLKFDGTVLRGYFRIVRSAIDLDADEQLVRLDG